MLREGTAADLEAVRSLSVAARAPGHAEDALFGFLASLPEARWWLCEGDAGPVGYARVVPLGAVEQLSELVVADDHRGRGIGRSVLKRCWPGDPSSAVGRLAVAPGTPRELAPYMSTGTMPVAGVWRFRQPTETYLARRSLDDLPETHVHALEPSRAEAEWARLEPEALGMQRSALHGFLSADRTCLGSMDEATQRAAALCWVGADAQIGPAVGSSADALVPVVLAAIDRVAKVQEPEFISVGATTPSWPLLARLRGLGFRVESPSWVMCSSLLPALERYVPAWPATLF